VVPRYREAEEGCKAPSSYNRDLSFEEYVEMTKVLDLEEGTSALLQFSKKEYQARLSSIKQRHSNPFQKCAHERHHSIANQQGNRAPGN
jgi:hypothetical protein